MVGLMPISSSISSSRQARQFDVYESPGIAAAFSVIAVRPSRKELTTIALLCFLSSCVCGLMFWMQWSVDALGVVGIPPAIAVIMVRAAQGMATILVALSTTAFWKASTFRALAQILTSSSDATQKLLTGNSSKTASLTAAAAAHPSVSSSTTFHQRDLLGISSRKRKYIYGDSSPADLRSSLKQRHSRFHASAAGASSVLFRVPVHPGLEKESSALGCNNGARTRCTRGSAGTAPSVCPTAAAGISWRGPLSVQVLSYPMTSHVAPSSGVSVSPRSSPWSRVKAHERREWVKNEESLARFLADVDEHILASAAARTASAFLPPSAGGMRGLSSIPSLNSSLLSHSGGGGTLPIRVFPQFPKGVPPPKFGEGELPGPMSLEQFQQGLRQLGISESIEHWRDFLRQWFSSVLLKPLVHKLDTSHWQVMARAAKLGIVINVDHIGNPREYNGHHSAPPATLEGMIAADEWLTPLGPDEDALMHQLKAALLQARDMRPTPQASLFGLQCMTQAKAENPVIQECLDAVTEHQRLRALMKGDWGGKGLVPVSSMRADYSVLRVRELADGTCAKQFDWSGHGTASPSRKLLSTSAAEMMTMMPSDSHLLLYLFCALLEHPRWMLHVDPTGSSSEHRSSQWDVNPLYVAATPHKERLPEKYIAVLPHAPGVLQPGACVLCIGKLRPPVFALYWDRKLQFSLQGRTALWDAVLLLCHRIKVAHGGVVRGIRLDSPSLILSSVMNTLYPTFCP